MIQVNRIGANRRRARGRGLGDAGDPSFSSVTGGAFQALGIGFPGIGLAIGGAMLLVGKLFGGRPITSEIYAQTKDWVQTIQDYVKAQNYAAAAGKVTSTHDYYTFMREIYGSAYTVPSVIAVVGAALKNGDRQRALAYASMIDAMAESAQHVDETAHAEDAAGFVRATVGSDDYETLSQLTGDDLQAAMIARGIQHLRLSDQSEQNYGYSAYSDQQLYDMAKAGTLPGLDARTAEMLGLRAPSIEEYRGELRDDSSSGGGD